MAAQPAAQGPSLMGTMGSSMVGSMAGSMIGNAMMGGSRGGEAPAPQAGAAPMAPSGGMPCQIESQQFLQCMAATNDNMDYCKNTFDMFKLCQLSAGAPQQQQFQ